MAAVAKAAMARAREVARDGTAHHGSLVLVEANSELQTIGLSPVCDCERTRSKPTMRLGVRARVCGEVFQCKSCMPTLQ